MDRSRGSGALEETAYEIKPLTRIHRVREALIGPDSPEGIAMSHRVAVMHYLLDMGYAMRPVAKVSSHLRLP